MEGDFPPNSRRSKETARKEEKVSPIVQGKVVRRKKPMGKRFSEVFMVGDGSSVGRYVMLEVLLPAFRDMVADAVREGTEKLIFGDSRPGRRPTRPGGMAGYTNYNKPTRTSPSRDPRPQMSRQARSRHEFEEVLLDTRREADEVLERMGNFIEKYDVVTVAELLELVGETPAYTDDKWGWTRDEFATARVQYVRGGYLLDLPKPVPIEG